MLVGKDRLERFLIDGELQARCQHHRAEHADGIFEEPDFRIADAANQPRIEVLESAGVVDDREGADVIEEGVDGEVTPERVLFRCAVGIVTLDEVILSAAPRTGRGFGFEAVAVVIH